MNNNNLAKITDVENEYLTFELNGEEYGIDILCVQEIRVWSKVTQLPNAPAHIKGVINLRGIIVPIIDLRQRFGKNTLEYNANTVTIILKSKIDHELVIGIVVDAVSEVYKFSQNSIRKPPKLAAVINLSFIKGVVSVNEQLILLLDTEQLLSDEAMFFSSNQTTITS